MEKVKEKEKEKEKKKKEKQNDKYEEEVENESINIKEFDNLNTFIISLQLIKTFDNMHQGDSETIIIDFLKNVGLPMHFNNEETLSLYLYFHKMCIPFYNLLENIKSEEVSDLVLNLLRESYYLLADKRYSSKVILKIKNF